MKTPAVEGLSLPCRESNEKQMRQAPRVRVRRAGEGGGRLPQATGFLGRAGAVPRPGQLSPFHCQLLGKQFM